MCLWIPGKGREGMLQGIVLVDHECSTADRELGTIAFLSIGQAALPAAHPVQSLSMKTPGSLTTLSSLLPPLRRQNPQTATIIASNPHAATCRPLLTQ